VFLVVAVRQAAERNRPGLPRVTFITTRNRHGGPGRGRGGGGWVTGLRGVNLGPGPVAPRKRSLAVSGTDSPGRTGGVPDGGIDVREW
jgi:hypothetical protein